MKLNLLKSTNFIISLLLILGGIGSILFGLFPIISIILITLGVLGSLFSILTSESRNKEIDYILEAHATLLAQHGIGNVYSQAFKNEMLKNGFVKDGQKLLRKALDVDPNDMDALAFLSSFIALQLSLEKWLGAKTDSPHFKNLQSNSKSLAARGSKLYRNNHIFLDTLGILFDLEGKHSTARKYFLRSGTLRQDSYWKLLLATSWQMSGEPQKALYELKEAQQKDAEGWLINFYLGRALNAIGDYAEAEKYLDLAFKERGYRPELVYEISQSYYLRGMSFTASKYVFMLSVTIAPLSLVRSIKYLMQAAICIGIGTICSLSKIAWKISRYIPYFRNLHLKIIPPDEPEFTLGNILLEKGNFKEAEINFRICCKIVPTKAESHAKLALCLALLGSKVEALTECDISIAFNPKNILFKHIRQQIESGQMKRIVD